MNERTSYESIILLSEYKNYMTDDLGLIYTKSLENNPGFYNQSVKKN